MIGCIDNVASIWLDGFEGIIEHGQAFDVCVFVIRIVKKRKMSWLVKKCEIAVDFCLATLVHLVSFVPYSSSCHKMALVTIQRSPSSSSSPSQVCVKFY